MGLIAGIDEVGRGPLAGPVIAAAVILSPDILVEGITDSKKLSEKKRGQLAEIIKEKAVSWSIGRAEVEEIEAYNILQASLLAMQRAYNALAVKPEKVLVDGLHVPKIDCEVEAIVKGDLLIDAIGAASIIAKVARDDEMVALDAVYPGYGLAKHKGYPTKQHISALQTLGVSDIHRKTFGPVERCLNETMNA